MKNKKNLILAPRMKLGGVSSFVKNIYPFFTYKTFIFYRGKSSENSDKLQILLNFFLLPIRYFIYLMRNRISKIIVNTSLSKECLIRDGIIVIISKLFRKKVLLIIHGFQEDALKFKRLLKLGYLKSDSIIVSAKSFAVQLENSGYSKPIYTQWNPVSKKILNEFREMKRDLNNKNKIDILFLSRIEKYKGIFIAIQAFEIVQKKYPNLSFKIAGKGEALQKAKEYIIQNNITNIEFLGYVKRNDKIKLLKSCDIFLFPTENEGLPINILEAMTAGQIIITRYVGGLVDLYKNCNFGFSINSTKPEDYANAICNVLENKDRFKKIAANNSKFAKENFHPAEITKKIEAILNSI